jgi:2-polyprenyl-6-methoxyphenol hydroxylase-like FAD-dependent oxidoreductase
MNTQSQARVCVVGAGMSGLACALAAAQAGAAVQVLEAQHGMVSIPAHVNVVPGMLRALALLGVADATVCRGFPYRATDVVDAGGRVEFRLDGQRLAGNRYPAMLGIRYDELMQVLHDAVCRAGVEIHFGCKFSAPTGDLPAVCDDADLVVVATGAATELATQCFPCAPEPAEIGQLWWRAVVARPLGLDAAVLAMGHAGDKAGAIPVGMNHAGIYLLQRDDGSSPGVPAQRVARLRAALSRYRGGALAQAAALLNDDSTVLVQRVRHALLPTPWHRGRFVAVGDAAHLLTPQFGQNGTQAIEDAVVLGALLARRVALADLPAAFSRRRAARVRQIHEICLQVAHWDLQPQPHADVHALWERLGEVMAVEP